MHCIRVAGDQVFSATQNQFQVHDWLVNDLCARRVRVVAFADDDAIGNLAATFTNRIANSRYCRGCGVVVFATNSEHLRKSTPG